MGIRAGGMIHIWVNGEYFDAREIVKDGADRFGGASCILTTGTHECRRIYPAGEIDRIEVIEGVQVLRCQGVVPTQERVSQ